MSRTVTSSFEHSLRRSINAIKAGVQEGTTERKSPPTFGDRTLLAAISLHEPGRGRPRVYNFWQKAGLSEAILASLITVEGPASDRYGKDDGMKHMLAFIDGKGKVKYTGLAAGTGEKARVNRLYLDQAIARFWHKLGFQEYQAEGWEPLIYSDKGFAYVLKRKPSGYTEEYAAIYAASPGRKLDVFVPDGSKPLPSDKRFKIPTQIMNRIEKEFSEAGIWQNMIALHGSRRCTTHPQGLFID